MRKMWAIHVEETRDTVFYMMADSHDEVVAQTNKLMPFEPGVWDTIDTDVDVVQVEPRYGLDDDAPVWSNDAWTDVKAVKGEIEPLYD